MAMGSEWAVAMAAVAGAAGPLLGTWLNNHLGNRKQDHLDTARKDLLIKALRAVGGDGWMTINTLARIIGADEPTTRDLLIRCDARGSLKNNDTHEVWALIRRQPLPEADPGVYNVSGKG